MNLATLLMFARAPERIQFKLAVLVYKCLHGTAPSLTDDLQYTTWLISRPTDTSTLLPHCCWLSVVHDCPPSVIGPSLLLLPILGTVCPNMSRPHPLCFPMSPQGFPFQAFLAMTFTATFVQCMCSDSCHFQTVKWLFLVSYLL